MNIRDLKYFVSVAKLRNFSRAAEECFVSQPTLSMQLSKLEGELGIKLFERDKKRVIITAEGEKILAYAEAIIEAEKSIKQAAKEMKDPFAGSFRLGVFPTLAPYLLPKIIPPLHKKFPKLELVLFEEKTGVITEKLLSGDLDAGILALPIFEPKLEVRELFTERFLLAVNKNHKLAKNKTVKMEDFAKENILLLDEGHCMRDQALEFCHLAGANESAKYRGTSLETLRQMVVSGGGVTFIPEIAAIPSAEIKYLEFVGVKPSRKLGLITRKTSTRDKLFDEVAKLIIDLSI